MQSLISPVFLRVGTKLETHLEKRSGTMILASYIFLISFYIKGSNLGFILLSFCLNGFWSSFMGILCCIMLVS
jgi:hypothetical protein